MNLTKIEQEVVFLKATNEMIDSIVNHEMLTVSMRGDEGEARFKSGTHQRLFNIILVDFLSKSASEITAESKSYLEALLDICQNPSFNKKGSISSLASAAQNLKEWLDFEVEVETWLPMIDLEAVLKIKRHEFIKICGNIAKHNFSRLTRIITHLRGIISRSNVQLKDEDTLLILEDIYDRFHTDILSYHASFLVEQLNNIRWGIHEYLEPEFTNSLVYDDANPPMYHYIYPEGLNTKFARNCYWELMNEVRSRPYIKRFRTYDCLKMSY